MRRYLRDGLNILLRRVPPEYAVRGWLGNTGSCGAPLSIQPDEKVFCHALLNEVHYYTPDEARNVYRAVLAILGSPECGGRGVFYLLYESVKDALCLDAENNCLCRFEKLLDFRELTHPLGPPLFAAAFNAYRDTMHSRRRELYSLSPIVRSDNRRIRAMLDRGFAENHFHLGGSVNAFLYSWVCLMNRVTNRGGEFKKAGMDKVPLDNTPYFFGERADSFHALALKAAAIRGFLFRLFRGIEDEEHGVSRTKGLIAEDREQAEEIRRVLSREEPECFLYAGELQAGLDAIRGWYGQKGALDYANLDSGISTRQDYKLSQDAKRLFSGRERRDSGIRAAEPWEKESFIQLAGEFRFLHDLFRNIYSRNKRMEPHMDLAYAYLIIWTRFRAELIQTNSHTGFDNFSQYQDRKSIFTKKHRDFEDERIRAALRSSLSDSRLYALEARFSPPDSVKKLAGLIRYLNKSGQSAPNENDPRLHYVIHFPKSRQKPSPEWVEMSRPRDFILRQKMRRWANQICCMRENYNEEAGLVTGVDACSNEIGCRPEVFAVSMRKLTSHIACEDDFLGNPPPQKLRVTYHAGEDFLDIADGIRAIDESVRFLKMSQGDRLGHALALGLDVEEWYEGKDWTLVMPRQDILDNAAWLYGKMLQYGLPAYTVEGDLQDLFYRYFTSYRPSLPFPPRDHAVDLYTYWLSCRLRGDDPYLYADVRRHDEFDGRIRHIERTEQERHRLLDDIAVKSIRDSSPHARWLYHNYHFNPGVKRMGSEIVEYKVSRSVARAVQDVQLRLQSELSQKNICIECNPSSNYLIGSFRRYDRHPIITFNDYGLFDAPGNPRLCVSINTDDQGVFDSCLENEYAIMACALESSGARFEPGEYIPPDKVYSWLDNIRNMGLEKSFWRPERKTWEYSRLT